MGFSPAYYSAIEVPKPVLYLVLTLAWISDVTRWLLCIIGLVEDIDHEEISWQHSLEIYSEFPSASALRIREALPLLKFGKYVERYSKREEDDISCIICLSSFKKNDAIRELCNCRHIFHSKCLDGWIDHEQTTCPLCRRSMLPENEGVYAQNIHNDEAWIVEPMLYLSDPDLVASPYH